MVLQNAPVGCSFDFHQKGTFKCHLFQVLASFWLIYAHKYEDVCVCLCVCTSVKLHYDASKGCSVLVIACKITTLLKEEK